MHRNIFQEKHLDFSQSFLFSSEVYAASYIHVKAFRVVLATSAKKINATAFKIRAMVFTVLDVIRVRIQSSHNKIF